MDRLQQAISKARSQREQADPMADVRPADAAGPLAQDAPAQPDEPRGVSDLWNDFARLEIPEKSISRNRLVAYSPGETAIPFDMLRTRILQQTRKNNWKRIALVSPESGAGKTTVAANLGLSFSRMRDKRTMIMDFDLRRMGLARALGQETKYGMAEVLERKVPFSEHGLCYEGNVVFGLNRRKSANPSELLQNPNSAAVLDEIETMYQPDLMFFDMPPLMVSDDSQGFLQSVDCALLIAAAEKTPIDQIDVAERQLSELTNVMGIILNQCRYTGGAHGYESEYY